jgi:hypothetical protein
MFQMTNEKCDMRNEKSDLPAFCFLPTGFWLPIALAVLSLSVASGRYRSLFCSYCSAVTLAVTIASVFFNSPKN